MVNRLSRVRGRTTRDFGSVRGVDVRRTDADGLVVIVAHFVRMEQDRIEHRST